MSVVPILKSIVEAVEYDSALPEEWRAGGISGFSPDKTLYEYQQQAIKNAARALYLYYGKEGAEWERFESPERTLKRKKAFMELYGGQFPADKFAAPEYFQNARGFRTGKNPIFSIYAPYFDGEGEIDYVNLINRMSFWMATGGGKTLVIVKLMAHLVRLKKARKIPPCDILLLAPGDHALAHIRRAVDDFNTAGGVRLEMRHLREFGKKDDTLPFNGTARVYYCRADHLSEERKEQMTDWRDYENGGRWFVFLDEAHKGGRDDSKRKAYYGLLARAGFLFNFSATFADSDDIYTAVARYNLGDFVGDGRGKKILRADSSFGEFRDFSPDDKIRIVLESLLALAAARENVRALRQKTGRADLYHMPLMLTLVNSVNTEEHSNDLRAFFETLRKIAAGELDEKIFGEARESLLQSWRQSPRMFSGKKTGGQAYPALQNMTADDLRRNIFGAARRGALEYVEDRRGKQIAFKLKTADSFFALIKIGDIGKWTKEFLRGMESAAIRDGTGDWFAGLDDKPEFSILMGSRAFFESWDSTRPNVINFINIGKASGAKIFITQSVGRGVRIAPLPGKRRRLRKLLHSLPEDERAVLQTVEGEVAPPETLILFATNQNAVDAVLEGMRDEDGRLPFVDLGEDLFSLNPPPRKNGAPMPFLVPQYGDAAGGALPVFRAAESALRRLSTYAAAASDSLLLAAGGMSFSQIADLRAVVKDNRKIGGGDYSLDAMLEMIRGRSEQSEKEIRGVREMHGKDIVHFHQMQAALKDNEIEVLRRKIAAVAKGGDPEEEMNALTVQLQKHEISTDEFRRRIKSLGAECDTFEHDDIVLQMRRCARHYYAPLITAGGRADFIRFIIDNEGEREFVRELEKWLDDNPESQWEWMFCKLRENRDSVNIPYSNHNRPAAFYPDFIFWMRRGNEYRIVFADPKGATYSDYMYKIDGYRRLFEKDGIPRVFAKDGLKVQVRLLLYNKCVPDSPAAYRRFWMDSPAAVFAD